MNIFKKALPALPPETINGWAVESGIKVDGHTYDPALCPQAIEPMECMSIRDKVTRISTLIKPVQSGGSTAGEVVMDYWCKFAHGLIQENWQDDQKSEQRWADRILPSLESAPLDWFGGRDKKICEARFQNSVLRVQGVFNEMALNSDTIGYQKNEEVHLWKPGHLSMARDRQTRVFLAKAFDISNASNAGTQLHLAFKDGTMQEWETFCPVCGKPHFMHFRWDKNKPELGGLRWNADDRLDDGRPNYNKIEPSIRYQFPCGHEVGSDPVSRRLLKGKYSDPKNEGAHLSHRSFISEAVSYDQISWLTLIQEYHSAIQADKAGDPEPMRRFITRRECRFYEEEMRYFNGVVIINNTIVKSREGLADRAARFWFADKQKGYAHKGEMTHYWLVIRDVMKNCDSQLVYEGLCQTDNDLLARLDEHECVRQSGAVDCGWDRSNVLQFCYRNNCNAQTTAAQDRLFYHKEEKAYRIYSEPEGLHKQLRVPPKSNYIQRIRNQQLEAIPDPMEPMHWAIHKVGSIKLLMFLRNHRDVVTRNGGTDFIKWEVPGDVSEEYKKHIESWEFTSRKQAGSNQLVEVCRQRYQADHMLICEAGIANLMNMAPHPDYPQMSILGFRLAQMGITENIVETQPAKQETQ